MTIWLLNGHFIVFKCCFHDLKKAVICIKMDETLFNGCFSPK